MKKLSCLTTILGIVLLQIVNQVQGELPKAIVKFVTAPGFNVGGEVVISSTGNGISIKGKINGLTPGLHGFHIHEKGDLGNGCKNAGGHFNPFNYEHGDPRDLKRHIGDLGNIEADDTGVATVNIYDTQACLDPLNRAYIGNLAMVIHSGTDDLGRGGNHESLKTGNAGSRVACGIIEIQEKVMFRSRPLNSNASQASEAIVELVPGTNLAIAGTLRITSTDAGILVEGKITGLSEGQHGFHVHANGSLSNQCTDAGGHFNPYNMSHGGPDDTVRHVGDLGNIEADKDGISNVYILNDLPSLDPTSEAYIGNLAIVVHEGQDDLGKGGYNDSMTTGHAGARGGCGLISVQHPPQDNQDQQNQQTLVEPYEETFDEAAIILPGIDSPLSHPNPHFATVTLVPGSSSGIVGELVINPSDDGILIQGKITGLTPGLHGFHIHENGDLGNQCKNAGGHFNPFNANHGAPEDTVRHVGDLGNIEVDASGIAQVYIRDSHPSLDPYSETYVGNLSIVIHALADDLGQGGNPESLKTGNAGARVACGLIRPHLFIEDHQEIQENSYPAIVKIIPGYNSTVSGELSIIDLENGILIEGTVIGLTPGLHGFHIHEKSDLGNGCKDAGGHFNPFNSNHGAPDSAERHVGDLGNIEADEAGIAIIKIQDSQSSLKKSSQVSILNRAIVIHALADDLGQGGNPESLKTGNAGARVGCGVIVVPQFTNDRRMINAAVKLKAGSSPVIDGELLVTAVEDGVLIEGEISGLTPGLHGFHIHEKGDLGNECKNAGGHFNPFNLTHGDPKSEERHVGDLGNIEADQNGFARIQIFDAKASFDLTSLAYIGDRAVVVHAGEDDLGKGGNPESLKTGNAGSRVGCGVIVILQEQNTDQPPLSVTYKDNNAIPSQAIVDLVPGSDQTVNGALTITLVPDGLLIEGQINNLSPGLHGFHIHEFGDLGNECKNAGPHFNPFMLTHGEPNSDERHVGDLGNIIADETNTARIHIFDPIATLDPSSQAYIGNRSFVVHAKPDDLGKGGDAESLNTGNAGPRLACGSIVIQDQIEQVQQQHFVNRKKRQLYTEDDFFSSKLTKKDPFEFSATSDFGGQDKSARVKIIPGTSKRVMGDLHIREVQGGIIIKGTIYGLTPGLHGFHFHEKGDLGNMCQNAGGHFNPFSANHGDRHDFERHVGDLGNIKADSKGVAHIDIFDRKATLNPHTQSFVGNIALVVHADPDDLGRGGNADSKRTGNSGARVGCGIVEVESKHTFQQAPFGHLGHQEFFDSPYSRPQHNTGGFNTPSYFQNQGFGGGRFQQQNNPHHGGGNQGSLYDDDEVPVYRPRKPQRLNLSFNFGPPNIGGFGRGYGSDY